MASDTKSVYFMMRCRGVCNTPLPDLRGCSSICSITQHAEGKLEESTKDDGDEGDTVEGSGAETVSDVPVDDEEEVGFFEGAPVGGECPANSGADTPDLVAALEGFGVVGVSDKQQHLPLVSEEGVDGEHVVLVVEDQVKTAFIEGFVEVVFVELRDPFFVTGVDKGGDAFELELKRCIGADDMAVGEDAPAFFVGDLLDAVAHTLFAVHVAGDTVEDFFDFFDILKDDAAEKGRQLKAIAIHPTDIEDA